MITGSSRGIGLAIAEKFSDSGYSIVLNCHSSIDDMNAAIERLKKKNDRVIGIRADVSNYEEVEEMFLQAERALGNIDVLVNNAGVSLIGLFNLSNPSEWRKVIDINLMSVLNCSHIAVQHMIRAHSGVIVNISSIWGGSGASCEAVYSASKGGINAFTKALAKELGPCGIRVNAVSCGVIDTSMNNNLSHDEKAELANGIPLMRLGNAKEIAEMVFFLSEEKTSYTTGQVITVDGGFI